MASDNNYRSLLGHGLVDGKEVETVELPVLDGYEIERKLGQGGMGSVYLAVDVALNRRVALKLFDAAQLDPASLERFQQESQMMAKVEHLNVVAIYGVITAKDEVSSPLCLVLEYISGGDLAHMMESKGVFSAEDVVAIAVDICDGLSAIHAQGIIHRDLKPANVLLTEDRRAKVADLGIAVDRMSETLTMTGSYLGSVAYVAPEQMSQTRRQIDVRVDIWALGVLIYEMLTGTPPQASLESDPLAKLPRRFRPIIKKCLKQNPAERFASAESLKQQLLKIETGRHRSWKLYLIPTFIVILIIVGIQRFKNDDSSQTETTTQPIQQVEEPVVKMPPRAINPPSNSSEIDLISLLNNPVSADAGVWRVRDGILSCDAAQQAACVSFPMGRRGELGDSYDVTLDFVRESGVNSLAIFLPTSIGTVTFELDGWNSGLSGIQALDGENLKQHDQVFKFRMINGRSYQLLVQVRRHELKVYIDGKLEHTCSIRGKVGSVIPLWNIPRKHALSVGAWASSMSIQKLTLKKTSD